MILRCDIGTSSPCTAGALILSCRALSTNLTHSSASSLCRPSVCRLTRGLGGTRAVRATAPTLVGLSLLPGHARLINVGSHDHPVQYHRNHHSSLLGNYHYRCGAGAPPSRALRAPPDCRTSPAESSERDSPRHVRYHPGGQVRRQAGRC